MCLCTRTGEENETAMIIKTIPRIAPGSILRQAALTAISDAAFMTNEYLIREYADGILSGCGLETTEDAIIVKEGTVFLDREIFLIKKPLTINYSPTNTTVVLKMCFSNAISDDNCIYRDMDLEITRDMVCEPGQIELCRFKLQEGAKLRCEYQDFEDRSTEFDTMNRVHAPYAAYGGSTLSPEITRAFAQELMDSAGSISDFDAAFCLQILGSGNPIAPDALVRYIAHTNGENPKDTTNMGVFQELVKILKHQRGLGTPSRDKRTKKWKMMME